MEIRDEIKIEKIVRDTPYHNKVITNFGCFHVLSSYTREQVENIIEEYKSGERDIEFDQCYKKRKKK